MRRLIAILLSSAVCATTGLGGGLVGGLMGGGQGPGEITLRASAIVGEGSVTLKEVATLQGREAEALADVVVAADIAALPEHEGWWRLELAAVRTALDAHDAPWGALTLRGSACALRIGNAAFEGSAAGGEGRKGVGLARSAGEFAPGTVGAIVTEQLSQGLGVKPGDLRVTFDPVDRASLSRPAEGLIVRAQTTGLGARTPITLRIYRGDWIETETNLRARIEMRRQIATTRRDLRRGEVIGSDDVTLGSVWLTPDIAPAANPIGAVARASIAAGEIVKQTDTEAPLVVRRRDQVTVDIVSGAITVQTKMRALQDGAIGDLIHLETMAPDRRDRQRFEARVNDRGRAVAVVNDRLGAAQ
jgi:flagella basal body P-ring formation protein FlgA